MYRIALVALLFASGAQAGGPLDAGRLLFSSSNLRVLAVGAGLAATAHTWDGEVQGELEGRWPFETTADLTNMYGSSTVNLPASLLLWSAGGLAGRPALRDAGADLARTLLVVQALVGPVKLLAHRERPDGTNHLSFPSGHTANAFAMARLVHLRHGRAWGMPLYALGALTAAGRLEDDRHYLSDVVMGSAVGVVAANCAVWGFAENPRLSVAPLPGGRGLSLAWAL